jgi:AAA15 family ATPase/GTPase
LIAPDASFSRLGHQLAQDDELLKFASFFLKSSSTGVEKLEVSKKETSEEELRSWLPESVVTRMLKDTAEQGKAFIRLADDLELSVEKADKNHFYLISIRAAHEHEAGHVITLDFSEESDGTRRLLNLIPALQHLRTRQGVYVIDEIDRSMHPLLTRKYLEFFLATRNKGNRQMIVTTHESNLLDLELLRRDEIWFAEKDGKGATNLYSLSDHQVRTDLDIQKHYLHGRFGAIPFLGNIDSLLEAKETPK